MSKDRPRVRPIPEMIWTAKVEMNSEHPVAYFYGENRGVFSTDKDLGSIKNSKQDVPIPSNLIEIDGIVYFRDGLVPFASKTRKGGRFVFTEKSFVNCGNFISRENGRNSDSSPYLFTNTRAMLSGDSSELIWIVNMFIGSEIEKLRIDEFLVCQNCILKGIEIDDKSLYINCKFTDCNIKINDSIYNTRFLNCTFEGCSFGTNVSFKKCILRDCNLSSIDSDLHECSVENCDLSGGFKHIISPVAIKNCNARRSTILVNLEEYLDINLKKLSQNSINVSIISKIEKYDNIFDVERSAFQAQKTVEKMLVNSTIYGSEKCRLFPYVDDRIISELTAAAAEGKSSTIVEFTDFGCVRQGP